jgi:hypothetical protein
MDGSVASLLKAVVVVTAIVTMIIGAGTSSSRYAIRNIDDTDTTVRTMCGSRTGGWSLPGVMSD